MGSTKGSKLDNKKSDDDEDKTKLPSDLNEIELSGFFDASLDAESIDGEASADRREMPIEKRKSEGALLNYTEKMFKRRRCHGSKVKKTPKEYRAEAEVDDQFKIESDRCSEERERESIVTSEETRKRRKKLDWQHVESFDTPQAFNRSQIKAELDKVMIRTMTRTMTRTSEARQESYMCKFNRKRGWKSCIRQWRVSVHYQHHGHHLGYHL